jgi:L-threonylcarbamoyladenylate synthase
VKKQIKLAEITQDIGRAKYWLDRGELTAIPTETVYGLAGNALNVDALIKIFEVKNRPKFDPLIVHIKNKEEIPKYAEKVNDLQHILAENFWPGPLTILFKKNNLIPDLATSGLEYVGLRCPAHSLTLSLLNILDYPLAAPSANPFGYVSPTRPEHVNKQLGEKIPCILDGGPCEIGIESTVVKVDEEKIFILRTGGITKEELEKFGKEVILSEHSTSNPQSPGQLTRHYATFSPLKCISRDKWMDFFDEKKVVLIYFGSPSKEWPSGWKKLCLSENEDLKVAASRLFHVLREADEFKPDLILAEPLPMKGIGIAINDKLKRAQAEN